MEETLSLPVNMPFDKRAVCTKSDTGGEVKNDAHSELECVELHA